MKETELKTHSETEIKIIKEYCKSWELMYTEHIEDSIRTVYEYLSEHDVTVLDDNIEIYDDFCVYEIKINDEVSDLPIFSMEPRMEITYVFESELLNNSVWKSMLYFHKKLNKG